MKHHVVLLFSALLILAISVFSACDRTDKRPLEKITIAFSATTESVLAEVALKKGFFLQEGLDVTPRLHPYGRRALEDMLAGNANFATVAETPVMFAIMRGEKISLLATIESSQAGNAILARKDKGIRTIENLKGKKIAVTMGTISDFFLDAILTINGITRKEVKVVDLKAEEVADALARGDIDAASTFNPYTAIIQRKQGDRVIAFQNKDIYQWTFNIAVKQDYLRNHSGTVEKMLHALVRAEEFVGKNPEEAQRIVADFSGINLDIVRDIWINTNFEVSLDQALILALEDESQWAIKNRLTKARKVPNYLDFIYMDGLKAVKPEAVRILR
jgi:sulfonate transport system substrate-binding protein